MKNIFCSKCQKITPHKASVDGNGEFLFECTVDDCGRFIKLPADHPEEEFLTYLSKHEEANKGQVSVEEKEKKLQRMLALGE